MCLAQIWALCDTNQSGKLTSEQFALAMWLVERKQNGIEPPQALAPNMIPPSLRSNNVAPQSASAIGNLIGEIASIQPIEPQRPVYSNPELEMIAKEIEELAKERRQLENDVVQKEADIRIKNGEVRNLQSELDTLVATLKQLESQKGEAQKRLNDLKAQVCFYRNKSICFIYWHKKYRVFQCVNVSKQKKKILECRLLYNHALDINICVYLVNNCYVVNIY